MTMLNELKNDFADLSNTRQLPGVLQSALAINYMTNSKKVDRFIEGLIYQTLVELIKSRETLSERLNVLLSM